jgi:TetR/AcrR family transcriptional repressor of the ameABC operon
VKRPRRKAEETREDILVAAESLLREKGMPAFSIADVAAELKMSPANIFKHFHSKAALADAICERHIVKMIERFQAFDEPLPAPERLTVAVRRLMETHLADIRENPYLFEMLVGFSKADLPSGRRYKQLIESLFADLIRHGIETGVYKCAEGSAITENVEFAFASVLHPIFLLRDDETELRERCAGLAALVNAALQNPLAK